MNAILEAVTDPNTIPSVFLAVAWFWFLRYFRYSGYGIALLSIVGTAGHEACHYAVGLVLGAKPVSVSLFPKRQGNSWVLGSVGFTQLNLLNSAPVAFAPLLLAGIGFLVFQAWTLPAFQAGFYISWLMSGYVVACCFFACIPSLTDLKIGALSGAMYGALAYGIWRAVA